jgi:hypothetical protein
MAAPEEGRAGLRHVPLRHYFRPRIRNSETACLGWFRHSRTGGFCGLAGMQLRRRSPARILEGF